MGSNLGAYVKNLGARLKIPPLDILYHRVMNEESATSNLAAHQSSVRSRHSTQKIYS